MFAQAQKLQAGDEYDFLNEVPIGLFDCYDSVNDFGHFIRMLTDEEYKGLPTVKKCNPEFFAISGNFEIHLQPIMSEKGPIARVEEDQGQTLTTYRYSKGALDWKSEGMLKCSFNAANLRKLIK